MADVHSPLQRSYNMSRIRGRDTAPEKAVRELLRSAALHFRSNVEGLPGKPDIALQAQRTAIFVHGCFWHRHKNCRFCTVPKANSKFWKEKFARTVERDRENARALRKLGWKVIVVWECAIKERPEGVQRQVLASINKFSSRKSAARPIT